jgi:acyl-CoA synthetase (AMP-forming)/AMP-acid ligase II
VASGLLEWIEAPSTSRGIHYAGAAGEWTFQPYSELAADAHRVAGMLRELGGKPGAVVSLLVADSRRFVPAFLGTMLAGLTPSPIASPLTFRDASRYTEHVVKIVRAAGPAILLSDPTLRDVAGQVVERTGAGTPALLDRVADLPFEESARAVPAEVALLQFTSGSSGLPKGVRVTPENLVGNIHAIHARLGTTPSDACSSWLPLYHDMGLIGTFLGSVVAQIDLWLMSPLDFVRSPVRWLECHGRHGATLTAAPNFGYGYASRRATPGDLAGMDFSGWRVAMNGAERIDARATADFTDLLGPHGFRASAFVPAYGLAEATLAVSAVRAGDQARIVRPAGGLRPGEAVTIAASGVLGVDRPAGGESWLASCGPPLAGTAVQVVDERGLPLPDGHFGEIRVQGPSVALGYQSRDGAACDFTPGGLHTGDSGFILGGEVFVVGRVGDSIKIRGRKVYAEDLEAALAGVPGIHAGRCLAALGTAGGADHAVVVIEAADSGWLDGALAVLRAATDDVVRVTIVRGARGSIPRTSSGKPRRRLVWQQHLDRRLSGDIVYSAAG